MWIERNLNGSKNSDTKDNTWTILLKFCISITLIGGVAKPKSRNTHLNSMGDIGGQSLKKKIEFNLKTDVLFLFFSVALR